MKMILVVDDDPDSREEIREYLVAKNYEVVTAANGAEGLNMARYGQIDLVITDLIMPRKDGVETIAHLKEAKPGIAIIAISGGGRARYLSLLDMAKKAGADRTFTKPLTLADLLKAVEELTQG